MKILKFFLITIFFYEGVSFSFIFTLIGYMLQYLNYWKCVVLRKVEAKRAIVRDG